MAPSRSGGRAITMSRQPTSNDSYAGDTTIVLYDAALGGTPDTQGRLAYRDTRAAAAVQSFADGCTTLDTTARQQDSAGYVAAPRAVPALARPRGYALRVTGQVAQA